MSYFSLGSLLRCSSQSLANVPAMLLPKYGIEIFIFSQIFNKTSQSIYMKSQINYKLGLQENEILYVYFFKIDGIDRYSR